METPLIKNYFLLGGEYSHQELKKAGFKEISTDRKNGKRFYERKDGYWKIELITLNKTVIWSNYIFELEKELENEPTSEI